MQHIKLQPEVGLAEIQDIVDTIADKDGTALKLFLKGELVLSKEVWQQLINLKFGMSELRQANQKAAGARNLWKECKNIGRRSLFKKQDCLYL